MEYVAPRSQVPLEAPNPLPAELWSLGNGAVQTAPNTARAEAQARSYDVSLYNCPEAFSLDSPRFERGCGSFIVAIYGSFGGNSYASPASALSALSRDQAAAERRPPGCAGTKHVRLLGGVEAEVYTWPTGANCLAHWDERGWEFVLTGFFASRNGWGAWPTTADQLIGYLAKHGLPAARGVLYCDIAGDGLPTTLIWADGGQTYSTSMYHSALGAIEMAEAMTPYPGSSGRRDALATLP
jgi:hypothetical protein